MRMLVLVGVLLVTANAFADPPKYTRKQSVVVDVKLSNRVKPSAPATAPTRAPTIRADDVLAIQREAQPIRRDQEALLEKLVRDTPDSDADKPDYLFRLAELYAQQLRFWRLDAISPAVEHRAR
jgi:hypothetical protein